jgi:hypothetical protein
VKEHVDNGTIQLVYCPTNKMWAEYFTKPMQGSQFYRLRDLIMNIDPSSAYHSSNRSVLRANESLLMNNDKRSTDRLNTSSDDDGETSSAQKDTRKMDSCTVISGCDEYSTVENDPEDNNGRSTDGFISATDVGACVISDSGGWITVEKKRSKDRRLTSNS